MEDFITVPIDKVANNAAFIWKHFYALAVTKRLNLDCHFSNQDDSNTYEFINKKYTHQIIKEHKSYVLKCKIHVTGNMEDLSVA